MREPEAQAEDERDTTTAFVLGLRFGLTHAKKRQESKAMTEPQFGSDGIDRVTFAPIELVDRRTSEWQDVCLSFDDWTGLQRVCGAAEVGHIYVDDYYLNGYGVQGLIQACRVHAGLDPDAEDINYNSEGDTCFIHFADLADAVQTARLASAMLRDRNQIAAMVTVAREHGFED